MRECQLACNQTVGCVAITLAHPTTVTVGSRRCALLTALSPGVSDPTADTFVRVPDPFFGRHRVFFDNQASIKKKVALARQFGLRGVSAWTANMLPYTSDPPAAAAMWDALVM